MGRPAPHEGVDFVTFAPLEAADNDDDDDDDALVAVRAGDSVCAATAGVVVLSSTISSGKQWSCACHRTAATMTPIRYYSSSMRTLCPSCTKAMPSPQWAWSSAAS